jgi:hypothetical protein
VLLAGRAEPAPTTRQLASRLVVELYRATSGRAMTQLRIDHVAAAAGIVHARSCALAIAHAVEIGLLERCDDDCICLTDEGRRLLR